MTLRPLLVLPLLLAACGGGSETVDTDAPVSPDVPGDPAAESPLAPRVPPDELVYGDRPVVPAIDPRPWLISVRPRVLDGLDDVVGHRVADDVTGASLEDVVLFARCLGDRTEVELTWDVALGDDVFEDDFVTKRVLVRFFPDGPYSDMWPVSNDGRAVVVDAPIVFLRRFVRSTEVFVQTTSWNGTVLLAHFVVAADVLDSLGRIAAACGWVLDPDEALAIERRDAAILFAAERQRVLESYVGPPIREDLGLLQVDSDGAIYTDLPAPVHRAYLGVGVSVSDVAAARRLGRGVICLSGLWVGDEIVLRDCYLEDTLDPGIVEGIVALPPSPP